MTPIQQELQTKVQELQQKIPQLETQETIYAAVLSLLAEALRIVNNETHPPFDPLAMINEEMCCDEDEEVISETPPSTQTPAPTLLFNQQTAASNPTPNIPPFDAHEANMLKLGSMSIG